MTVIEIAGSVAFQRPKSISRSTLRSKWCAQAALESSIRMDKGGENQCASSSRAARGGNDVARNVWDRLAAMTGSYCGLQHKGLSYLTSQCMEPQQSRANASGRLFEGLGTLSAASKRTHFEQDDRNRGQ